MSTFTLAYNTDKEIFPAFHDDAQEWREGTTFYSDFKIAERFGIKAVKDTFKRAFSSWKTSAKYIVELCAVTNHLCWEADARGERELCEFYGNCYYKCYAEIFKADEDGNNTSAFSDDEVSMMHRVLD